MIPVLLDPGHGGDDDGASDNGIVEKDYVLKLASAMYWLLYDTHWIRPHMSRVSDEDLGLDQAGHIGEVVSAKYALAIHINAHADPKIHGMTNFYLAGDTIGKQVATAMQRAVPHDLRRRSSSPTIAPRDGWTRRVNNVLMPYRKRDIPCSLIELAFCTNENDALLLNTPLVRHQIMGTILTGLETLRQAYGE